jgi:hypothetical protein
MRSLLLSAAVAALFLAGSAQAAVKFYDSSAANGTPSADLNPDDLEDPGQVTEGYARVTDSGTGIVTLEELVMVQDQTGFVGPDVLTELLGPGAFFFSTGLRTESISSPHVSNTSGIGAHGPSSTAPGASAEWGLVTGFSVTGVSFCISSPPLICNQNVSAHGATTATPVYSATYDLGTWNFDTVGDLAADPYIFVTANGGLTNRTRTLNGAFHGASLPALPLVGFGALAVALLVLGARTMRGAR